MANSYPVAGWAYLLAYPGLQLLSLAAFAAGGGWPWAALAAMTGVYLLFDNLMPDNFATAAEKHGRVFNALLYVSSLLLALILFLFALRLPETFSRPLTLQTAMMLSGFILVLGFHLGISVGAAGHELFHRTGRPLDLFVGRLIAAAALRPDFPIEHVFGHHRTVATPADPTSAPRGMIFWCYLPVSLAGSQRNAFTHERQRLANRGLPWFHPRNAFLQGSAMSIVLLCLLWSWGGLTLLACFASSAIISALTTESFNYIAHYGLARVPGEPVRAAHSWNSYRGLSTGAVLNLPRHAHHHVAVNTPYWRLQRQEQAPVLPHGSSVMALFALLPPLFMRVMREPLQRWDREMATPAEAALARKAYSSSRRALATASSASAK